MRNQVDRVNAALLEAKAAEAAKASEEAERRQAEVRRSKTALAERTELVAALHRGIEAVGTASAGIEDESANIAQAVDQLVGSLGETADAAGRAEDGLHDITSATADSMASIARLDQAGREIVGIVDTITELSEQTNLLALNATIEAARAGEAGKGFAVVANEVKDLASRTAQSASGIADVVNHIQTRLAESNGTIEAIAELVRRVEGEHAALATTMSHQSVVVGEISDAASHGLEGVTKISQAIRHLDEQAATLAEGTKAG